MLQASRLYIVDWPPAQSQMMMMMAGRWGDSLTIASGADYVIGWVSLASLPELPSDPASS